MFGDYIRRTRERRGIDQQDLATSLGRSPSWLSDIERGRKKALPEPEELRSIAGALGVSGIEMMIGAGYLRESDIPGPSDGGPEFLPGDIRADIVEMLKSPRIPEQVLLGISQMLDGMIEAE